MEQVSKFWLCACFLYEPVKFTHSGLPPMYNHKTGGDLFWMKKTANSDPSLCVVLGVGSTKHEAKREANNYLRIIGEIHGEGETVLEFQCTQETQFSEDF